MEEPGGSRFNGIDNTIRKKRSQTFRRPPADSQLPAESRSPLSSTPPSDEASKASSDENNGWDTNPKRKDCNLNRCVSRVSSVSGAESGKAHQMIRNENGVQYSLYNSEPGRSGYNNKRFSEGVLAPANWKSSSNVRETVDIYGGRNYESQSSGQSAVILDGSGYDNKVKKVKLKVRGVTRTIHANSSSNGASEGGSSTRSSRSSDVPRLRQKLYLQEDSDEDRSPPYKKGGLQGIPWKDFSQGGFRFGKEDSAMGRVSGKNTTGKRGNKPEVGRKSKRVPKRRALDDDFDEDDEIRYLEKLKSSKISAAGYKEDDQDSVRKQRKLARISDLESRSGKDAKKKPRSDRMPEDTDYEEEEEPISDHEPEGLKRKKQRKESVDSFMDDRGEMTLTTRQRALQSSKGALPGTSLEFPNGLPPAAPKKQKEKLSEVEQQLRKAEAAQRRRMQVEKAARESEAEAIRKILGQDSTRKKREDKIKKRQEELAQERAANALTLSTNTIRWVMGPAGTIVTFSNDMGLPHIFEPKHRSYPPPRENCSGPSCTNAYKYRDSKSKLPLCSLRCYKAIHEKMQAETTC